MISKILAPLFGSREDQLTLAVAAEIAEYFHAHVEVAGAVDARRNHEQRHRDADHSPGEDDASVRLAERNENLRAVFDAWLRHWGVEEQVEGVHLRLASASWLPADWSPAARLHNRAMFSDIAVVASKGDDQDDPVRSAIEAIVFHSGRPVLLRPIAKGPAMRQLIGGPIVVGWNDSAQAARAVAAALPFLRVSTRVEIVAIGEDTVNVSDAFEVAKHLAWHGIRAMASGIGREDWTGADIVDVAMDRNAEMLVMGANRHYDKDVGRNVTRHVLDEMPMTVFMMS